MSDPWSLDNIIRLRTEPQDNDAGSLQRDERFHESAALLSSFKLVADVHKGEAAANLIADSVPLRNTGRWTLKNSVRRRVLQRLHTRKNLQDALRSTAKRPEDLLQRTLEACLDGSLNPLRGQTASELAALLQVTDWFAVTELKESLPELTQLQSHIEYAAFVDPLHTLSGTHFRGRTRELETLGRYVDSTGEVSDLSKQPPMIIFGPGGMGKSSLLAAFVLKRIGHSPMVYLDCDRPDLSPREPLTFLVEAVRQLGLQFEAMHPAAKQLREAWLTQLALASSATTRRRTQFLDEFRVFVNDLGSSSTNLLFAIDTFEQVQQRSVAVAREVFDFLSELQDQLPHLRTVIAGRNPASGFPSQPLELGELDQEAACGLLESFGVTSPTLQSRLASLLHRNPLSLRLAAGTQNLDGSSDWENIERLTDDTAIQGILYGRILGHIQNEDVKRIAHPGLVLRRITREIISDVLAEPCGVDTKDPKYVDVLFDLLRNELSLVVPDGNAVRHRADIRRVMLTPLRNDRRELAERIEKAAVTYYLAFDDPISRAEEIYHRLALGDPVEVINQRWLTGIEDPLYSAIEELPAAARKILAMKLGIELDDQNWDLASEGDWATYAVKHCTELLRLNRPAEAVHILRRRAWRPHGSPLYWLHAQALRQSGQLLEAREIARSGIVDLKAPDYGDVPEAVLDWYAGPTLSAPPSRSELELEIRRVTLLGELRLRTPPEFIGRHQEMAALDSYVLTASGRRDSMTRRPLLIYGPGGIGKSALVSRFVLDRLDRVDVLYLNAKLLDPANKASGDRLEFLWMEMYRQVCLIYPNLSVDNPAHRPRNETALLAFFASVPAISRPLLLFFDEFDELAAIRPEESIALNVYGFFAKLQQQLERLRVVITARRSLPALQFERLELSSLDREAALGLLEALGVESADARDGLVNQIGQSPLTLTLAAQVYRHSGPAAIDDLPTLDRADIASHLFDRMLRHIPSDEIRRLVYGALALRRVTADIVMRVLAEPCGLKVETLDRAHQLMQSLEREGTLLITGEEPGVLVTRPDMRRLARQSIGTLTQAVTTIDTSAIAYYNARPDPLSRAEEIFHRLMRGDASDTIQPRWIAGVEPYLLSAIDEVSDQARIFLAARLGVETSDIEMADADQHTWETYVVERTRHLTALGQLQDALEVIRKRSTRARRSPLFAIESQILLSLSRAREALEVTRRGLDLWPDDPNLTAVRAAAESAIGASETPPPAWSADTSPGDTFFLRDKVTAAEVLRVLKQALPTSTDAMNAFRHVQSVRTGVSLSNLEAMVSWAANEGRLDELVTTAARYVPDYQPLKDFIATHAKRVEASAAEPFTQVLLQHGEVFLNRQVLREFLRDVSGGTLRSRVLLVNGPPGSGKSYTSTLVDSVARATGQFEYATVAPPALFSTVDLIESILSVFNWQTDVKREGGPMWAVRFAYVIQGKAEQSRLTPVLHIAIESQIDQETEHFILELVRQRSRLALIVSGLQLAVPRGSEPWVLSEQLGNLTLFDVEDGLSRVLREAGRSVTSETLRTLAERVIESAEPGERFNGSISRAFRAVVAQLMG